MKDSTNNTGSCTHEKTNLSLETTKKETTPNIEPSPETDDTPAINQTEPERTNNEETSMLIVTQQTTPQHANIEETATATVTQHATPPHQLTEQCSNRDEGESEEREGEAAAANEEGENIDDNSEVDETVLFIEER